LAALTFRHFVISCINTCADNDNDDDNEMNSRRLRIELSEWTREMCGDRHEIDRQ